MSAYLENISNYAPPGPCRSHVGLSRLHDCFMVQPAEPSSMTNTSFHVSWTVSILCVQRTHAEIFCSFARADSVNCNRCPLFCAGFTDVAANLYDHLLNVGMTKWAYLSWTGPLFRAIILIQQFLTKSLFVITHSLFIVSYTLTYLLVIVHEILILSPSSYICHLWRPNVFTSFLSVYLH
jgi:hypothetical protein